MKTSEILNEIKQAVLAIEPSAEIILFGSEARGTAGKNSDIDLLIILEKQPSYQRQDELYKPIYKLELKYEKVISPFFIGKEEWEEESRKSPFYYEVQEDGIKL